MNLFFKILTFLHLFLSFFQRKVLIKNIKGDNLVLDVGSGDKPFWRADVIVDKYLTDDQQRHSGEMMYDRRKIFIEADVEEMPFKDKTFDFVFCTHLLEHVKNPDRAIRELTRVAKRGYIEVPNGIIDLLEPFPPHLWFCDYRNGVLFFIQKESGKNYLIENTESFGKFFFWNPLFQYLITKFQQHVFIGIYWEGKVEYRVVRSRNPYVYVHKKDIGQDKNLSTRISFLFYKYSYAIMTALFYKKKNIKKKDLLKTRSSN